MIRCTTCVIPTTRPDTFFDETGRCAACVAYEARPAIDWQARKDELLALLARARALAKARGNHYDCIVPSSGGKDSHYQVLKLLELGARPLAVTATTCHLTPIGRRNLDNLARYATTIEVSPNKTVRAKLNRLGLELVGDVSWPEHVSIFTTPFAVAARTGIPFLFYGENPQNQYGGPLGAQDAREMTQRWVSEYGGFLGLRPADLIGRDGLTADQLSDYILPAGVAAGLEAHFLGQYLPWDSHANAARAAEAGMEQRLPSPSNWWPHENLDNAQTGLHDYGMYLKYGYGRGAAQLSVDIRTGRVAREAALQWLDANEGHFPCCYAEVNFTHVLARIGLPIPQLRHLLDRFTNWELFRRALDDASDRPILVG